MIPLLLEVVQEVIIMVVVEVQVECSCNCLWYHPILLNPVGAGGGGNSVGPGVVGLDGYKISWYTWIWSRRST